MRAETQAHVLSVSKVGSIHSPRGNKRVFSHTHQPPQPSSTCYPKEMQQILKNLQSELKQSHQLRVCYVKKKCLQEQLPKNFPNKEGTRKLIITGTTESPAAQVRMEVSIKSGSVAHPVGQMRVYFKSYQNWKYGNFIYISNWVID